MKCPNCNESLWFVRDVCPFCKITLAPPRESALAATAPPDAGSDAGADAGDGERWVTLLQCETLGEADAVRSQLEAAGIAVFLPDESLMQTAAWYVLPFGFIRLQVTPCDLAAAREMLSAMRPEQAEAGPEIPAPQAQLFLSWPMRCFAFLLPLLFVPGFFVFAVAKGGYARQHCARRSAQWGHWYAAGWAFWFLAVLVLVAVLGQIE